MCDNHTAIRLLHKPIHDLRIRHVDILYNLILQYKTLMKLVSTTAHQLSDIFTILLPDDKYIFPGPQIGISDSLTKEQNLILFKILYYLIFFFVWQGRGVQFLQTNDQTSTQIRSPTQFVSLSRLFYYIVFLKGNVHCSNCFSFLCLFSLAALLCVKVDSRLSLYIPINEV